MHAALVIASGKTSWSDGFDPYLEVGHLSAVQRIVLTLSQAGVDRIVLVGPGSTHDLERHIARMGAVCLPGGSPKAEMLDNIKLGLDYLKDRYARAVITPVDVPLFSADTVRQLLTHPAAVSIPVYAGRRGHPIALSRDIFPAILAYNGRGGLDAAIGASAWDIGHLEVTDGGILHDVGTGDAANRLQLWAATHELRRLRPQVRISLAREKVFFGPGTLTLLELIGETGSLKAACSHMGISYSKGWKMLQLIEAQLGCPMVASQKGGTSGGSSALTGEGKALVERYRLLLKRSRAAVEAIFADLFGQQS